MEPISLSILVVNCKNYVPSHNWYLCKSGRHFSAAAKSPDSWDYDEERLNEYDASDDYILMPECPQMTDEEAAEVVRSWCQQNNIPYCKTGFDFQPGEKTRQLFKQLLRDFSVAQIYGIG